MRKFVGDKMPNRGIDGQKERIINFGMQDPRIVCGVPVRVDELEMIGFTETSSTETMEHSVNNEKLVIDPVRAIHTIAAACGLELRAE